MANVFANADAAPLPGRKAARKRGSLYAEPSRWADYLWDRRKESAAVNVATGAMHGELVDYDGDTVQQSRQVKRFAGELFGRLFEDSPTVENEGRPGWVDLAAQALDGMPEFERLCESVAGDADFAALAASDLLQELAAGLGKAEDKRKEEEQRGGRSEGASSEEMARAAVRKAVRKADGKANETRGAMAGILPGSERAPNLMNQKSPARMRLAEALRNDDALRRVIKMAGRLQRMASREAKRSWGREEVVDVERGGDIARILPGQLARLMDPDLELLAYRDIIERQALQYRLIGNSPMGRGPIVVALDRSGSMSGGPIELAVGVVLALALVANREGRRVTVIPFDHGTHAARTLKPGAGVGDVGDFVDGLLGVGAGGGTSFGLAIQACLAELKEQPRADLVFVTDGYGENISGRAAVELDEAKESGLRVWGVTVNGGSVSRATRSVCDDVVSLDGDPDAAAKQLISGAAR